MIQKLLYKWLKFRKVHQPLTEGSPFPLLRECSYNWLCQTTLSGSLCMLDLDPMVDLDPVVDLWPLETGSVLILYNPVNEWTDWDQSSGSETWHNGSEMLSHHTESRYFCSSYIWATAWQNQQNVCAQWRLTSAWASAQSDQSLCCVLNG